MEGVSLEFYMYAMQKHRGQLLYEWMLEKVKEHKIYQCAVFRGIAGFDSHGKLHEEHFFELVSDVPLKLLIIAPPNAANDFLEQLSKEKISLFYTRSIVECKEL